MTPELLSKYLDVGLGFLFCACLIVGVTIVFVKAFISE